MFDNWESDAPTVFLVLLFPSTETRKILLLALLEPIAERGNALLMKRLPREPSLRASFSAFPLRTRRGVAESPLQK